MADPIGGGVAPGRRGSTVTQTTVRRVPMWVPWDHGGKGGWRLVPADNSHGAQLVTVVDGVKSAEPLYQGKKFVPEQYAQEHVPALVEMAERAIARAASEMLPAPDWAKGVLGRYPDLVSKPKAGAGVRTDAA